MSDIESYDGLCGIIPTFASSDIRLRCNYSLGHSGPCSFEKYRKRWPFWISSSCNSNTNRERERGFIDSVLNHKK